MSKSTEWYLKLFPLTVIVIGLYLFSWLQPFIYPVVKDFLIAESVRKDGILILRGQAKLNRECDLQEISAEGHFSDFRTPEKLVLTYSKFDGFVDKTVGNKTWGPWEIRIKDTPALAAVDLHSTHKCGWFTVPTRLQSLPATYIDLTTRNERHWEGTK